MRIISRKILREFREKYNDAEEQLKTWYKEVSKANWATPNGIKNEYAKASILKNNRVVFNICGNSYRLILKVNYKRGWVFIKFIGTHTDYDSVYAEASA